MGLFLSFEGPEGSGKSTQAQRLYQRLAAHGYTALITREPGGTAIGDMLRQLLLDMRYNEMAPTTESLLFSASRAQLVHEKIRPFLASGGIVICDRFADSTYAYQGYGLGRNLEQLRSLTQIATGGLQPDMTVFLDIPVEEGLDRKRAAAEQAAPSPLSSPAPTSSQTIAEWNRLDAREVAFHERVRTGYHEMIAAEPQRWLSFDARLNREALSELIWHQLQPHVSRLAPRESIG